VNFFEFTGVAIIL